MATTVQSQDELRTQRNFISLVGGALGLSDQSLASYDSYATNPPGGYQVIDPRTGNYAVQGTAYSTAQGANLIPPLAIMAGVALVAWLALRRG